MKRATIGAAVLMASALACAESAPTGVHAGAWAGAAAAAMASAAASSTASQTAAQQVVSQQSVTVAAASPSTAGGGSSTSTIRATPDAYAPTMNATAPCRISVSAGVSVIGLGASGGGSVEDDQCNLRETARLLSGIGQPAAAARVMCNDPRAALALGREICPPRQRPPYVGAPSCWQDEIIAKRLGAPTCDTEREQ